MSTKISMEVVKKYLEYFIWEESQSPECYGDVLKLTVFKTMLYVYCQNPKADIDEDAIKAELAKIRYSYITFEQVEALAIQKAKEIREAEAENFTNFELFKTQKAVEYMRKDFAELMKQFKRLERKLK